MKQDEGHHTQVNKAPLADSSAVVALLSVIDPKWLIPTIGDVLEGVGQSAMPVSLRIQVRSDAQVILRENPQIATFLTASVRAAAEPILSARNLILGDIAIEVEHGQRQTLKIVPTAHPPSATTRTPSSGGALWVLSGPDHGRAFWLESDQVPRRPNAEEATGHWQRIDDLQQLVHSSNELESADLWPNGEVNMCRGQSVIYVVDERTQE